MYFATHNFIILAIFLSANVIRTSDSKLIDKCDFVHELLENKFSTTYLRKWVCLAQKESKLFTDAVNKKMDGSYSYGIFQINSARWCKINGFGGECNKPCEDFINDDLTDDSICAKKIFDTVGWKEWRGLAQHCTLDNLPRVSDCPSYINKINDPTLDDLIIYRASGSRAIDSYIGSYYLMLFFVILFKNY